LSVNINHSQNKIEATGDDLVLTSGGNISVSAKRVTDVQDPVNAQDAVTKKFLEDSLENITGGAGVDLSYIVSVLGKLTPQSPQTIDSATLSILNALPYRITDFSQTDNTGTSMSASPGSTVASVLRTSYYTSNTLTRIGPGDSGELIPVHNNADGASFEFTENTGDAGTSFRFGAKDYVTVSNNVDYGTITGDPLGFFQCYDVYAHGTTVPAGWNSLKLVQGGNETNTVVWYSDQSNPGAPVITNKTITPSTTQTGVVYSSTVPHYTTAQYFDISFDVANLSGDFYPSTDNFIDASAALVPGSAINNLADISYTQAGITTPLPRNYLTDGSTVTVTTSTNIKSGTGVSDTTSGPAITVSNSYATATTSFVPGRKVLYMYDNPPTTTYIDETNIFVSNVGYGTGNGYRTETVAGDTPAQASFTAFDGETSVLNTWDATIVAGRATHDTTDYSTGYFPEGPDLSSGRTGDQYFQVAFSRTAVSKFAIKWSGKISGCWVKLPGTSIDNTSDQNGWLDATIPYEGSGVPGANTSQGGNGTNGCGLGSVITTGIIVTNQTTNITFGTESSSNADDNLIVLRFKLASGDYMSTVTAITAS
jgi:hypothetical protein